jgi:hypothetical protein
MRWECLPRSSEPIAIPRSPAFFSSEHFQNFLHHPLTGVSMMKIGGGGGGEGGSEKPVPRVQCLVPAQSSQQLVSRALLSHLSTLVLSELVLSLARFGKSGSDYRDWST